MKRVWFLVACAVLIEAGCSVRRDYGDGKPLGACTYCVLSEENAGDYYQTAKNILGRSFTVVDENDPLLESPQARRQACPVTIDWARGFWSTSGWVDVKDWKGEPILRSSVRRGMFWAGAHGDVMESLNDVAAARAAEPSIPAENLDPVPAPVARSSSPPNSGRTKAERLTELNELRIQGLISDPEYSKQRARILDE
jgi:hypothetical protein